MTAYDPSEWSDLKGEGLPERALETVLLLVGVLLVSVVGLIPSQSHTALGLELLAIALVVETAVARLPTIHAATVRAPRG